MKTNNKQNRTNGTILSQDIEYPAPMKSFNSPSSEYELNKKDKINEKSKKRY